MEEKVRKITPWKVIKWTAMTISAFVYIVSMWRIFVSCDADISDDIILTSEEKSDFDNLDLDYPIYNYQPISWTSADGTIQIKNVYYIEPLSELQLTVRYRISSYETKENKTPFYYNIRVVNADETERVIEELESHTETRYNYKYIRLCADDIRVESGEKVTSRVERVDEEGNSTFETVTETVGGNKVYLDIYDSESDELLYSFVVAGKTLSGVRVRRAKVDTRIKE